MKQLIMDMEEYAKENNIPIMQKEGIAFLMKYIKNNHFKNVLEIGSAIGYSAILMASSSAECKVTTIERDQTNYLECVKNVKKCNFESKVSVVFQDALDVNLAEGTQYDLIFIDAAKGQYRKFFEKFQYFLAPGGVIITDNLKFHGYVGKSDTIESKNLRQLVKKIEGYIDYLKTNEEFTTEFYDIGDGVSVSKRVENEK